MGQHPETDKAIGRVIDAGGVFTPAHQPLIELCRLLEQRFIFTQDRANDIAVQQGKTWNLARDLFEMLRNGEALTKQDIETLEFRIYGEPRKVAPHRSGGGDPLPKTNSCSEKP